LQTTAKPRNLYDNLEHSIWYLINCRLNQPCRKHRSLNKGRSTAKLSPPESAYASPDDEKEWQAAATPFETSPPPPEMKTDDVEQSAAKSLVVEPLLPQQTEVNQRRKAAGWAQPTSPPVAPWPENNNLRPGLIFAGY